MLTWFMSWSRAPGSYDPDDVCQRLWASVGTTSYPILLQSTLGAGKEAATLPAILAQATWLNKLSKFLENAILDSWKRFCQIDYPNRDRSRGSSLKKHTVSWIVLVPQTRLYHLFHEDCPKHFSYMRNRNRKSDKQSENFIHPGAKHCSIQDVTRHKWRNGDQFFVYLTNIQGVFF